MVDKRNSNVERARAPLTFSFHSRTVALTPLPRSACPVCVSTPGTRDHVHDQIHITHTYIYRAGVATRAMPIAHTAQAIHGCSRGSCWFRLVRVRPQACHTSRSPLPRSIPSLSSTAVHSGHACARVWRASEGSPARCQRLCRHSAAAAHCCVAGGWQRGVRARATAATLRALFADLNCSGTRAGSVSGEAWVNRSACAWARAFGGGWRLTLQELLDGRAADRALLRLHPQHVGAL